MANPNAAPIGVFDSGCGGLTVMRALMRRLPSENIVYFGDTARVPYGNKSQSTILRYSLEGADFLAKQQIKLLIVACNTVCVVALEALREQLQIPVIGVTEQGVDEVARLFPEGKVAVLGTRATIQSEAYARQLKLRVPDLQLISVACPLFVSLVEEGYLDHPMSALMAHEYLSFLKEESIQGAVLGCTHYPLLAKVIGHALGDHVRLIDPSVACAERAYEILSEQKLLRSESEPGTHQFFVSEDPQRFRLLAHQFLQAPITDDRVALSCG